MPANPPRRVWCSCTIIDYLEGNARAQACEDIIAQAKRRELQIVVSVLAMGEVAKLSGTPEVDAEAKIRDFFNSYFIVRAGYDVETAARVRELVRRYPIKPYDAAHMATALQHGIPILETFDTDLLNLDEKEGSPPLIIRRPHYDPPAQSPQGSLFDPS